MHTTLCTHIKLIEIAAAKSTVRFVFLITEGKGTHTHSCSYSTVSSRITIIYRILFQYFKFVIHPYLFIATVSNCNRLLLLLVRDV